MEELQREAAGPHGSAREARLAALSEAGAVSPAAAAAQDPPESVRAGAKEQPPGTEMGRTTAPAPKTGQALPENAR